LVSKALLILVSEYVGWSEESGGVLLTAMYDVFKKKIGRKEEIDLLFIGQMFYLSQSEIKFHNIATKSKFGVRTSETICFAENVDSLPIFT
jgi:hypothetical protein